MAIRDIIWDEGKGLEELLEYINLCTGFANRILQESKLDMGDIPDFAVVLVDQLEEIAIKVGEFGEQLLKARWLK